MIIHGHLVDQLNCTRLCNDYRDNFPLCVAFKCKSSSCFTLIPVFPVEIRYPSPANTSGTPARRPGGTPSQYNRSPNRYLYRLRVGFVVVLKGSWRVQMWDIHPKVLPDLAFEFKASYPRIIVV